MDEEQLKLRLMGIEVILGGVLKHLPAAKEELLQAAIALDAPPLDVPDRFGPALSRQIRAVCGIPGQNWPDGPPPAGSANEAQG